MIVTLILTCCKCKGSARGMNGADGVSGTAGVDEEEGVWPPLSSFNLVSSNCTKKSVCDF